MEYLPKFKNLSYAIDLIRNDTIYLNNPFNFNDPLDSYFITLLNEDGYANYAPIKNYIDLPKNIKIFCATKTENLVNVLMWTHYADFHRGIAIKYKVPEKLTGTLDQIQYDDRGQKEFFEALGKGNPLKIAHKAIKDRKESRRR